MLHVHHSRIMCCSRGCTRCFLKDQLPHRTSEVREYCDATPRVWDTRSSRAQDPRPGPYCWRAISQDFLSLKDFLTAAVHHTQHSDRHAADRKLPFYFLITKKHPNKLFPSPCSFRCLFQKMLLWSCHGLLTIPALYWSEMTKGFKFYNNRIKLKFHGDWIIPATWNLCRAETYYEYIGIHDIITFKQVETKVNLILNVFSHTEN